MADETNKVERRSKTGLRACPFCGSLALSLISYGETKTPICISCDHCGASGPCSHSPDALKSESELRALWEIRATEV